MKKILLTAVVCVTAFFTVNAQETFWKRNSGLRFGYTTSQELECKDNGEKLESSFGANFAYVWSIALHKEPILDRVKFALEFGPSINYVQFDENEHFMDGLVETSNSTYINPDDLTEDLNLGFHQADLGFKLGASVIVRPFTEQDFRLQGFFHVTPSASVLINDEDVCYSFVPFLDYGLELSWKRVGVGVEMRQGTGKYKLVSDELEEKIGEIEQEALNNLGMSNTQQGVDGSDEKIKLKTKSFRVYLVFKF